MSDVTGAIVGLIALKTSGVLDKFMEKDPKKPGTVYTYDPGVDYTVKVNGQEFKNKGTCRVYFHKLGLPVPEVCK